LETLLCFKNRLRKLEVDGLEKLEEINCYNNFKIMNKVGEGMPELSTIGCNNLKVLDIDLNGLKNLDFSHLPNLNCISVRQNCSKVSYGCSQLGKLTGIVVNRKKYVEPEIKETLILNSPHLALIDTKLSNVKEITNQGITYDFQNREPFLATLNNPDKFTIITNQTDETS
jgi:hypothetical protein